jgi:anti-sigma B factor antagonist
VASRTHFLLPVQHLDGSVIAALPTEIDIVNAAAVTDALLELLYQGASGLVADMTRTRFCDVAGVRAIVRAHCHAHSVSGWFRVVVPDDYVRRIFALTGAEDIVTLYPGLDAALLPAGSPSGRPASQIAGH